MIMMKKYFNFLMVCASFLALTVFVSCSEDEPTIIDDDPIPVANGMYVVGSATSTSADIDFRMGNGVVGGPDFTTMSRTGMFSSFYFLGSGDFQFIQYNDGDSTIYGGTLTATPLPDNENANYYTGTLTEDGDAITTPAANSLHHVVVDLTSNTIVIVPIEYWEIIGPASAGGWGSGTQIPLIEASAESTVFELTEEALGIHNASGDMQYKFRYNSNWDIAFDDIDEFNVFTNFGITDGQLLIGGSNIELAEPGVYTINATFNSEGPAFTVTRTGDAEPVDDTFNPDNFKWGVIGTATAGGWDSDRDLFYKLDEEKGHRWAGIVYLIADDGVDGDDGSLIERFKFRANDAWDVSLGGTIGEDAAPLDLGGADIPAPAESGAYYVEIYTTDEGTTWNGSIVASSWGVIGDGSPQGNWDADVDMTANGFADGVTTYTITGDFTTAAWKFRANDDWVVNLGGDLAALSLDGSDITLTDGGSLTVTLSVSTAEDGTTLYSATVQ